jgi:hypothetical protein
MKSNYSLLFIVACLFIGLNASAQLPQAGKKYRISHANSGLFLTCDPEWNGGSNPFFVDSLYTTASSFDYTSPYEGHDPEVFNLNLSPEQQIFTLVNPDPNDPELYAIETASGRYLTQSASYAWDCILGDSPDVTAAQCYIIDDTGLSQIRFTSRSASQFIAPDNEREGISINKWDDGWEYSSRSYVYNDKPSSAKSYWEFQEYTGETSIKQLVAGKTLTVFPAIASETLNVNVDNGTKISIYSVGGAKVSENTVSNGHVNVATLPAGIYILSTSKGEKAKFIKK